MVSHRRRRIILTALGLYTFAALFIGYFGVNAFTGAHGLRAQADLDKQLATMDRELVALKAERAVWERRVSLLALRQDRPRHAGRAGARALLGLSHPTRCDAAHPRALAAGSGAGRYPAAGHILVCRRSPC